MAPDPDKPRDAGRDAGLSALARSVERLSRRLGGVEEALADLAETVTALDAEEGSRSRPASWLARREPDQAEAILRDLAAWLETVYLRYAGATLPACWLWHPDVVEELLWLRQAHAAAFGGRDAHIHRVADWHDRHRPGVARRIRAAIGSCDLTEHLPGGDHHHGQPQTPTQHAIPDLAAWAANGAATTPPVPTPDLTTSTPASRGRQQ